MQRSSLERYILWFAPAMVIQMVVSYFFQHLLVTVGGLGIKLFLTPADLITVGAAISLLPGLVTAVWIYRDSDASKAVRVAWCVAGFLMSYRVLIPYIGSKLLSEKQGQTSA